MSDDQNLLPGSRLRAELLLMDCVDFLRALRPGSVHMMFTDPAYAALEKHRTKPNGKPRGTTVRLSNSGGSSNDWFDIFPDTRYDDFFVAAYRAMVTRSHLYMMCAADDYQVDVMKQAAIRAGFRYWKRIVWNKDRIGMGYHWRAQHEYILFFEKGNRPWHGKDNGYQGRPLNFPGWPDVQVMQDVERSPETRGHLLDRLIATASAEYATISELGIVSEAAMEAALRAVFELDKENATLLTERKVDKGDDIYPTEKPVGLIERFVLNSSNIGEWVVDPFLGSGSTMIAALNHGRRFAGCDHGKSGMRALTHAVRRTAEDRPLWMFDDPTGGPIAYRLI